MDADGGGARPGLANLGQASGKGKSTLIEHLTAATDAGYLAMVERGGFRQGSNRASEYAATVPVDVFERREVLLSAAPWGRAGGTPRSENLDVRVGDEGPDIQTFAGDEGPVSRMFVSDEGPETWTFAKDEGPDSWTLDEDEGPVSPDEGPVSGDEGPDTWTPPRSSTTHLPPPSPQPCARDELTAVVEELHKINPGFAPAGIRTALETARNNGRPLDLVAAAARRCFGAPDTRTPARLNFAGPWWTEAVAELGLRAPRPDPGGRCHRHATALTGGRCRLCADEQPEPATTAARCPHGRLTKRWDGKVPCPDCDPRTPQAAVTGPQPAHPSRQDPA